MDNIPKNSIVKEKEYFLSKLKRNPIFTLTHLPSLSSILWRRYKIKYFQSRAPHQAGKIHPPWLTLTSVKSRYVNNSSAIWLNLPPQSIPATLAFLQTQEDDSYVTQDQENYLRENRWGNLIEHIFVQQFTLPENVCHWLYHPPPKTDGAWETYSCCERIANFLTWASFLPIDKRLALIPDAAIHFLQEEMQWIAEHLEYYRKQTGNHILNNARALIMAGSVLKNPSALEMGVAILRQMLPILIQPQGALREGSTHYQLIVFKWLLDAYLYAKESGFYASTKLQFLHHALLNMQAVAALFCDPQGELNVFIGDISPDADPLTTCATLRICHPAYWPFPSASTSMQADDWHVLCKAGHKIILHGANGPYPQQTATHRHNDLSSFVWTINHHPLLIDTGRARYTKDQVTTLQKSATGHNVALVNNMAPLCESLIINGNWCPTPYAKATIFIDAPHADTLTLTHDGFKRATPVKKHRRQIQLSEEGLSIRDEFFGHGEVDITLIWQIHPSFKKSDGMPYCELQAAPLLAFYNEQYIMQVNIQAATPPLIELIEADEALGFHSTAYGNAKRHPVLMMHWKIALPFQTSIIFKVKTCAA